MISGEPTITQENFSPCVYLDHWALRNLSQDTASSDRFTKGLKDRGGTLSLSWLNLVEFTGVTDNRQIDMADRLVEQIAPNIVFIALDPWLVISNEDAAIKKNLRHGDWLDKLIFEAFVNMPRDGLSPISTRGLFRQYTPGTRLTENLAATFLEKIQKAREQYSTDKNAQRMVNKPPKGSHIYPATRFLIPELLRVLIKNPAQKLTINDASDFLHSVVPLAYCNYVLLDAHWATQAKAAADRLRKVGHVEKIALTFSGPTAIQDLIHVLET